MFAVSVTKLQNYHEYVVGVWGDSESIILDIMGIKTQKISFDLGNLVDSYINDGLTGKNTYDDMCKKTGMFLHDDGLDELDEWLSDYKTQNTGYVVQKEIKKTFDTNYGPLVVSGITDVVTPSHIDDNKTTKSFSFDTYINNFQGYLYTNMIQLPMRYNVFKVSHITNRVKFEGTVLQTYRGDSYVQDKIEGFMRFVVKNDLQIFIDRPDVFDFDTYIFGKKHFYKTIGKVLEEDPGYVRWMMSKGYNCSEGVVDYVKNIRYKLTDKINFGKHKDKSISQIIKEDKQWITWIKSQDPSFLLDEEALKEFEK